MMKAYFRIVFERVDCYSGINIIQFDVFPLDFTTDELRDPAGWVQEEIFNSLRWDDIKELAEKVVEDAEEDHIYEMYGLIILESYKLNSPFDPTEYSTSLYLDDLHIKVLNDKEVGIYITDNGSSAPSRMTPKP